MTQLSEREQRIKTLRDILAQQEASGQPPDTSWTDNLPSDPLPEEGDETSVTFLTRSSPPQDFAGVLKWDPSQPRNPAGTSQGGRWAKGRALADIAPVSRGSVPPGMERGGGGGAGFASIMNAPQGTGFGNAPRLTGDPEMVKRLNPPPASAAEKAQKAFSTGEIATSHNHGGGANASYVVEMDDSEGTKALLKPEVGELWTGAFTNSDINQYITNRNFSLAEREATAYEISQAMGIPFVPVTVHRENLNLEDHGIEGGGGGSGAPDSVWQRQEYDKYHEKAQEDAMDAVGQEMGDRFNEAQKEHVQDITNRAEEMTDIWNNLVEKEFPEDKDYAAQMQHPVLPMGSQPPFQRRTPVVLDPLEVLNEAKVDVTSKMSDQERGNVEAILRQHLQNGVQELGEVDEVAARDHLDYDKWIEEHQDTENRLYESKIKTFDSWRQSQGYESSSGSGVNNSKAPHPDGGSLQHYLPISSYGTLTSEDGAKMAALDYVLGTMDRHGGNMAYLKGHPVAIDNGYSLPASDTPDGFTFRSVAVGEWMGQSDRKVPESTRTEISNNLEKTDWKALIARHPNMNEQEREALLGRVENMKEALKTDDGLKDLWNNQSTM